MAGPVTVSSLLDISDQLEEIVPVGNRGQVVRVVPMASEFILALAIRFPGIQSIISENREDLEGFMKSLTPEVILSGAPEAVGVIIATCTGSPNDPAAEIVARKLGFGDQLAIFSAIIRLTMPRGVGPFVVDMMLLVDWMKTNHPAAASASGTTSRQPSLAALQVDGPKNKLGATRLGSSRPSIN